VPAIDGTGAATGKRPLAVCYIPGIDLRRVDAVAMPHLDALLKSRPSVRLRGQATHASAATLLSGTGPQRHGAWGPQLRPDWRRRSPFQRGLDLLPDWLTTAAQGARHLVAGSFDLATMPPRRRRRFAWHRLNMKAVRDHEAVMREMNGAPSLFSLVGRSRYAYVDDQRRLGRLLDRAAEPGIDLDVIANHTLDYLQHWNLHDEATIRAAYRATDDFLRALQEKCERRGFRLLVISDHGQEPVLRVVDPRPLLAGLDLPDGSFDHFTEYAKLTFWFHTRDARRRTQARIDAGGEGVLLPREDLRRYGVDFTDGSYGDAVLYLAPGASFFPNDFYHPLANALLALSKGGQGGRWRRPWHQGEHGYLPDHPCEDGFMVAADDRVRPIVAGAPVPLLDVAPSILALLGLAAPPWMEGRPALAAKAG
jgi:hypothetical protein